MSNTIGWGVLGTGGIAEKLASQLGAAQRGYLAAVDSRQRASASRFTEQTGGTPHSSYESLLSDGRVDAVYVSLPNALHHPWTLQALRAGKHVLRTWKFLVRHSTFPEHADPVTLALT